MFELRFRTRVSLALQREVGRFSSILWVPLLAFIMRVLMSYRVDNVAELRKGYRALMKENDGPVLICANHLTMVDSLILAWALGGSWWYVFNYRRMPWNLPEYNRVASVWFTRFAAWVTKCIPIMRGGPRQQVSGVIKRVQHVLSRGDIALIFAEGGRSRDGRVRADSTAHGMGRIINAVEDCKALCVYLRGERQQTWSTVPAYGDSFHVEFEFFQPESLHRGMRRSRDLAQQIVANLARMEDKYFAAVPTRCHPSSFRHPGLLGGRDRPSRGLRPCSPDALVALGSQGERLQGFPQARSAGPFPSPGVRGPAERRAGRGDPPFG